MGVNIYCYLLFLLLILAKIIVITNRKKIVYLFTDIILVGDCLRIFFNVQENYVLSGISSDSNQLDNIMKLLKIDVILIASNNSKYLKSLLKNVKKNTDNVKILIISDTKSASCNPNVFKESFHINTFGLIKTLDKIFHSCVSDSFASTNKQYQLTKREREILFLIYFGKKTKEIADELYLSYKTVENHRNNILKKTNSKNMLSLINKLNKIGYFIPTK